MDKQYERRARLAATAAGGTRGDDYPMLEIANVTAKYGELTALWDITIKVPSGSVVALIGPNGAGKTTAMRVASGLLRPTSGTTRLDGVDITKLSADARARVGMCLIPEGRGIYRSLTVKENLELQIPGGELRGVIDPALQAFPVLGRRLRQRAGSLSGGEQQMLAVSRAYLASPKVVLFDEVSMGLGPLVVDEIFTSIQSLASTGMTVLMVEQYVRRALGMSDFAIVMAKGRVVAQSLAADLTDEKLSDMYLGGRA